MKRTGVRVILVTFTISIVAGCQGGTMIDKLMRARENKKAVGRPTSADPKMTVEKAYELQYELASRLKKEKGEKHIGYKLSPKTVPDSVDPSKAIPVYGYLFESMILPTGASVRRSDFIDLHLENEVAFVIGEAIPPDRISSAVDLKQYVKFVVPAIELPDVRFRGPIDDITGIDLIADNVAASRIMLGEGRPPVEVDADMIKAKMVRDGDVVNEGTSTMVEGSPWNSLYWLVKKLGEKGETLRPGQVIMTGGIAKFMDGQPGDYEAAYTGLGTIKFRVTE